MRTYTVTEYEKEDYDTFENGLTRKEIINGLHTISCSWLPDYNYTGTEDDFEFFKNHAIIDKAIELLEREEEK